MRKARRGTPHDRLFHGQRHKLWFERRGLSPARRNPLTARPSIATYPQISAALGQAVVKVLLGQTDPQTALNDAAKEADGILAAPA